MINYFKQIKTILKKNTPEKEEIEDGQEEKYFCSHRCCGGVVLYGNDSAFMRNLLVHGNVYSTWCQDRDYQLLRIPGAQGESVTQQPDHRGSAGKVPEADQAGARRY